MRREEHLGPDHLLHLRRVAVVEQAVGDEVLVHRGVVRRRRGLSPRPRGAARRVDDQPARLDEAGGDERRERERRGRHVAAGCGDEPRPGERGAGELRQAVDREPEEFRRGVDEAVPASVGRRVLQAEVRAEVDDERNHLHEPRHDRLRAPSGHGDEGDVTARARRRVGRLRRQTRVAPAEAREEFADRRPGRRLGLGRDDLEIGMRRQQSQQLGTEIPRRPDDGRPHGMNIL